MTPPKSLTLAERLQLYLPYCKKVPKLIAVGQLKRMVGIMLEAEGCQVPVGGRCLIINDQHCPIEAEVVGFSGAKIFLMPIHAIVSIEPGARVIPLSNRFKIPIGEALLGRVIDGCAQPLDGKPLVSKMIQVQLQPEPINPLTRATISKPLDVGIRVLNALLTVGSGQRIGLFAGSGVGKSVLLGMMTKYTEAEITIVGLVGERGREVKEFIDQILGKKGMQKSVVVASPADASPLMRIHAALLATRIAEYFRDQGKQVLLLMDSLTRFAQAQREISLAVGEPPATRGYTPSVFARLSQLVERAGNGSPEIGGSITAFYTVLTEEDDMQDPIADAARSILDGHIVLSRRLAEEGIYPAIDVEASISRVMPQIVTKEWLLAAQKFKKISSTYEVNKDLINIGAYTRGSDPNIDLAITCFPKFRDFIQQSLDEKVTLQASKDALESVLPSVSD